MALSPLPIPRFTIADLEDRERFPEDGSRYELLDGWLIVSPGPRPMHEWVALQIAAFLNDYLERGRYGLVFCGGTVQRAPDTELRPDGLVVPPDTPLDAAWDEVRERWLVVEVLSQSTQLYDRTYKVPAYHALGVPEVWLVDVDRRRVEVWRPGSAEPSYVTDVLTWQAPTRDVPLRIDVAALLAGPAREG